MPWSHQWIDVLQLQSLLMYRHVRFYKNGLDPKRSKIFSQCEKYEMNDFWTGQREFNLQTGWGAVDREGFEVETLPHQH